MSLLERIQGPKDLKALPASEVPALAEEIRQFLVDQVSRTGGHLGPNLGVVELTIALHRVFDSPHDSIVLDTGHQSYVHKLLTGRHDFTGLRTQGGHLRVPQPRGVRARHRRELARLHLAVVGARHRRRPGGPGRAGPAHRGRHRRRRPHRRHGLGGDQQHRRRARPTARRRRQRQHPLLRPDPRRPRRPPRDAAHHPRLRTVPRLGQAQRLAHAGRGWRDVRDAARGQEGHQGHRRPAGHVRGPRPEVRRPDRRPRRAGGGGRAAQGPGLRRPGPRPRHHPEGPRVRPRRQPRGRPVPRRGCHQPRDRPAPGDRRPQLDRRVRRHDGAAGRGAPRRRRDHRRDDDPGRARAVLRAVPRAHPRRRHRRAARPDDGGRARLRRHAPGRRRLRDLPQPGLRPAAHGLRAAPGRRHRRPRPLRRSPVPTARRTTGCGT